MTDEQIFDQVIQLPVGERAAFLASECKDQPELRTRIEALIAAHEQADSMLDTEAMAVEETSVERPIHQTIGDFEIIRELGRGGMGVVYEARQKSLKRKVALKVLSSGLGLSSRAILRFRREAEAAGKLHHTNIVPIYTTGEERGIHFYAMELIDGPSLDRVIRELRNDEPRTEPREAAGSASDEVPSWLRETALYSESHHKAGDSKSDSASGSTISSGAGYFDTVATIIADVADALDHAHEHGVIHRDVKPSNLLLAPDGRLSINDFGLARMLEQPGMTMTGEFVGSPLYMSPEQITAGRAPLDHRTDIYSLGATLYELLTLQPPFPGESRDQVIAQVLHKEAPSTRRINRKVPVDLDTICMKAIEKDPDRRYQTAGQLADDLRRYVNRHAISARRVGVIGKLLKSAQRNPVTTALISFVLLVMIAASVTGAMVRNRLKQIEANRRQAEIDSQGERLMEELFRGQTNNANELIRAANNLGARQEWLSFHQGLRQLFRQDYEDAKAYFEDVTDDARYRIPAKSLLAIAYMWHDDEYRYFRLLNELRDVEPVSFEDKFFLGYAHTWGDAGRAYALLDGANKDRPDLQYVVFLRGVAARGHASINLTDLSLKKKYIDLAMLDLKRAVGLMPESPLVLKELTLAHLHCAKIYKRLADAEPANREQHLAEVQKAKSEAFALLPRLLAKHESSDVQYAIVMLLSELASRDEYVKVADSWQTDVRSVSLYAAQFLSLKFATWGDESRARYWLRYRKGKLPGQLSVETFVKLVDANRSESIAELRAAARQRAELKIRSGETENVSFDVMSMMLLGDKSYLHYYDDDRLESLIGRGEAYKPMKDYFCPDSSKRMTAAELIARCNKMPSPNAILMHANFYLGIEAMADRRWDDAEEYFEVCRDGDEFMFSVYFLSDLLLAHRQQWESWPAEWDDNETSPPR